MPTYTTLSATARLWRAVSRRQCIGALVAVIGGFVYAELGARRPRSGGSYVYLRDAWGSLPAFLYGWALFLIMATGAIAAVAMTGAGYLVALLGWDAAQARPVAAALITGLTALNVAGVRLGAVVGNLLTVLKLAAIAALVVAAFLVTPGAPATVAPPLAVPQGALATVVGGGVARAAFFTPGLRPGLGAGTDVEAELGVMAGAGGL